MKKMIVDILMFILMLIEFSRVYLPTIIHEIIGIILLILVIIHLILNKNYLKNIFKTKYNLKNSFMVIVNCLLMLSFILTSVFGLLSSKDLLVFLNIGNLTIIHLHKVFAYICLLLIGIHLGINLTGLFKKISKLIKNKVIFVILEIIIIILGVYSFIKVDFWNHLIGKYGFSIVTGNLFINILEYLSIVLMITIIINFIYIRIGGKKNER